MPKISKKHTDATDNALITTKHTAILSRCCSFSRGIGSLSSPYLKAEMIKDDAVVIDVGITRVADETDPRGYRITGDVDYDAVSKKASYITPVPGGVGPMTVITLLQNTLEACEKYHDN